MDISKEENVRLLYATIYFSNKNLLEQAYGLKWFSYWLLFEIIVQIKMYPYKIKTYLLHLKL